MSMVELSDTERKIAERMDPNAGRGLVLSPQSGGISFTNADQAMSFAKMMALSSHGVRKHLRGNPGACLAIVVQAVEWGVSAYAVANKSYFVNDQIAFESQLMQAVILRRAPIKGRIRFDFIGDGQDMQCRAWARDRDEPDEIYEVLTPKVRDIPTKNSPLWKGDPAQQLSYYAGRALCRRHFPDVLLGIYTPEELQAGIGTDDALKAPPRDAPLRGLQSKLDALAGDDGRTIDKSFGQDATEPASGDIIDHDHTAPANDDSASAAGPNYDAMLADLDGDLSQCADHAAIEAVRDEAGWVADAPADIQAEAEKMLAMLKARIDRNAEATDPHAELKALARKKAEGGMTVYNRWMGTRSDDDRVVLRPMIDDLRATAAEVDRQAGRG